MVSCLMLNVGYFNYYLRILYVYLWKLIFLYFYLLVEIVNLYYYYFYIL